MSQTQPSCFISYSHDDIDRETMDYLCWLLDTRSGNEYTLLVDSKLRYGNNIDEFMRTLDEVDAVLLIMTPSYKTKVEQRKGGVYTEYTKIMDRYYDLQDQKRLGKKSGEIDGYFALFPVLFSGTHQTSVPSELDNLLYLDLVGLRVQRNRDGTFRVSGQMARKFIPEILKIVHDLRAINELKSKSFEELYENYFTRLFRELKADWYNPRDEMLEYRKSLFVKTRAFKKARTQAVYFHIGRKGSGKTTIANAIYFLQKEKYKEHISIIIDDFNLEALYYFFNFERIRSDTTTTFPRSKVHKFAWEAFIYVCIVEAFYRTAQSGGLFDYQVSVLEPAFLLVEDLYGGSFASGVNISKSSIIIYCSERIVEFMDHCIARARSEERYFHYDIERMFTRENFLEFVFGAEGFESINTAISTMTRRLLITLDGFDSTFDRFRRESIIKQEEIAERAKFEEDWLRSFLHLILEIKQVSNEGFHPLYRKLDVCIAIPEDRLLDTIASERDSYRYHDRFAYLKWSGIELAILLRKRLEELSQTSTDQNDLPEKRLENVLRSKFKHIPVDLSFTFNDAQYKMPLFMYVLRHTIWRPREVLLYYAEIIAFSESLRKKGYTVTTEALRRVVKDTTEHVINKEFLGEFETTILNIREIVDAFRGSKQVFGIEEMEKRLGTINFEFATGYTKDITLEDKVDFLYQLGFIGIYADRELCERLGLRSKHAFSFNEGNAPLKKRAGNGYREYHFVIHPLFSEYLDLDTSSNELILQFTWSYLHDLEATF